MKKGFVMSVEAMFSLLFISLAVSSLALFNFQRHDSGLFYLCSDAAAVIAKTGDFSPAGNIESLSRGMSGLSGVCIGIEGDFGRAHPCADAQGADTVSVSIPVWDGVKISKARISCSRTR